MALNTLEKLAVAGILAGGILVGVGKDKEVLDMGVKGMGYGAGTVSLIMAGLGYHERKRNYNQENSEGVQ